MMLSRMQMDYQTVSKSYVTSDKIKHKFDE